MGSFVFMGWAKIASWANVGSFFSDRAHDNISGFSDRLHDDKYTYLYRQIMNR